MPPANPLCWRPGRERTEQASTTGVVLARFGKTPLALDNPPDLLSFLKKKANAWLSPQLGRWKVPLRFRVQALPPLATSYGS